MLKKKGVPLIKLYCNQRVKIYFSDSINFDYNDQFCTNRLNKEMIFYILFSFRAIIYTLIIIIVNYNRKKIYQHIAIKLIRNNLKNYANAFIYRK